jgi:sugar phosphate isomerase/epimerase
MKIDFFCPGWGSDKLSLEAFLKKAAESGYNGVEISLPEDTRSKNEIVNRVSSFGLSLIAQHWETLTPDFKTHREEYRRRLTNLADAGPLFINSQTGKDYFSFGQNEELIGIAYEISAESGVKIIHETHRGKFSFAAQVTADYLLRLPELRLGLDISHWVCVAESWLDDQAAALDLAFSRADHIHARVGFPEGPQIADPRAPEWKDALDRHTAWWKRIIQDRKDSGDQSFTITSEFGPYPYMFHLPYTNQPVADQWEINVFMMNHLRKELL